MSLGLIKSELNWFLRPGARLQKVTLSDFIYFKPKSEQFRTKCPYFLRKTQFSPSYLLFLKKNIGSVAHFWHERNHGWIHIVFANHFKFILYYVLISFIKCKIIMSHDETWRFFFWPTKSIFRPRRLFMTKILVPK